MWLRRGACASDPLAQRSSRLAEDPCFVEYLEDRRDRLCGVLRGRLHLFPLCQEA